MLVWCAVFELHRHNVLNTVDETNHTLFVVLFSHSGLTVDRESLPALGGNLKVVALLLEKGFFSSFDSRLEIAYDLLWLGDRKHL